MIVLARAGKTNLQLPILPHSGFNLECQGCVLTEAALGMTVISMVNHSCCSRTVMLFCLLNANQEPNFEGAQIIATQSINLPSTYKKKLLKQVLFDFCLRYVCLEFHHHALELDCNWLLHAV